MLQQLQMEWSLSTSSSVLVVGKCSAALWWAHRPQPHWVDFYHTQTTPVASQLTPVLEEDLQQIFQCLHSKQDGEYDDDVHKKNFFVQYQVDHLKTLLSQSPLIHSLCPGLLLSSHNVMESSSTTLSPALLVVMSKSTWESLQPARLYQQSHSLATHVLCVQQQWWEMVHQQQLVEPPMKIVSTWFTITTVISLMMCCTVPAGPPRQFFGIAESSTSITVSWNAPTTPAWSDHWVLSSSVLVVDKCSAALWWAHRPQPHWVDSYHTPATPVASQLIHQCWRRTCSNYQCDHSTRWWVCSIKIIIVSVTSTFI